MSEPFVDASPPSLPPALEPRVGPVLAAEGLRKVYRGGDGSLIEVVAGVDLEVARGEFVAIVGASGAGKSTLLHLLGALDHPTAGTVRLDGEAFDALEPAALARVRNRKLGFVFQFHHLLREFTALENVMMPLLIAGAGERAARSRATELLTAVGLAGRLTHRPAALSGGEQQRVAVARALAADPLVVLADEPSGNLDHHHAERLHDLFASLAREFETALVVVTHNRLLAARADRVLTMEGGRLRAATELEVMP
ncbi:MAG TPA: ABC transporter ATP-binding protein [Gemmatimonadales bacterium]|nr:ABC transporter ATP-binding protein [Gemmatimonadales bacterium]